MKLSQVRPSARTAGCEVVDFEVRVMIRRMEVEEFGSLARATPRDHRIYRTAKLELEEDVEGVGWYVGR